jgi:hypothetical protein
MGIGMLAVVVPLMLELLGVVPPSFQLDAGRLVLLPRRPRGGSRSVRVLLLAFVACVACKSPPPNDPALVAPGKSKPNDKCTVIPHGCPGGVDEDGCPDPMFEVGDACTITAQTAANLATAANELNDEKDLSRMRIIAPTMTCANIFRAHLEQHGVADYRLTMGVDENRSTVSFEVDAWKEVDCKTGGAVKPPVHAK